MQFPLTVVFGYLDSSSSCYAFLTVLQEKNSKPAGASPKAENRLVTQFHAQYPLRERTGLDRLLTISFLSLLRFLITFCPGIAQSAM